MLTKHWSHVPLLALGIPWNLQKTSGVLYHLCVHSLYNFSWMRERKPFTLAECFVFVGSINSSYGIIWLNRACISLLGLKLHFRVFNREAWIFLQSIGWVHAALWDSLVLVFLVLHSISLYMISLSMFTHIILFLLYINVYIVYRYIMYNQYLSI